LATDGPGIGQFAVIQAMAPQHAVELTPVDAHNPVETQAKRIAAFASAPNGGLIVTVGGTAVHRDVVMAAAAKNRLPAIYPYRYFAADGGLISYGPDTIEHVGPLVTLTAFSRARNPQTCRYRRRSSMSW
jgi:hypothetical protein